MLWLRLDWALTFVTPVARIEAPNSNNRRPSSRLLIRNDDCTKCNLMIDGRLEGHVDLFCFLSAESMKPKPGKRKNIFDKVQKHGRSCTGSPRQHTGRTGSGRPPPHVPAGRDVTNKLTKLVRRRRPGERKMRCYGTARQKETSSNGRRNLDSGARLTLLKLLQSDKKPRPILVTLQSGARSTLVSPRHLCKKKLRIVVTFHSGARSTLIKQLLWYKKRFFLFFDSEIADRELGWTLTAVACRAETAQR